MRLWRISNFSDLSGEGGLRAAARWHSRGRRVVYLADHPSSALTEMLVHLEVDVEDLPTHYQLLAVDISDEIAFDTANSLPTHWRHDPAVTRTLGDRWLQDNRTALLRVPSAVSPAAWNWLLNPSHADAGKAQIVEVIRAPLDPRLFSR